MGRSGSKRKFSKPGSLGWGAVRRGARGKITEGVSSLPKKGCRFEQKGLLSPGRAAYLDSRQLFLQKSFISSLLHLLSTLPSFLKYLLSTHLGQGKTLEIK